MAVFDGLTEADFQFLDTLDAVYKPILRERLQAFGEAVHEKLPADIVRAFPGPVRVPRWSGNEYQRPTAIIGREGAEAGPFQHCNFVLRLEPDGLHVNAVIRDGRCGEPMSPITCLARAIDASPARFISVVVGLGPDHAVSVFERKPIHGDRIMRGNEEWVPKERIRADTFDDQARARFRKLLQVIEFPGIHIGIHVPKAEVIDSAAISLVRAAAGAIQRLWWVIRFAEQGVKR